MFKGVDIPDSTKTTVRIADMNGNGSRDIVWIDSSGKVTYLELFGKRPNLMTDISNGIGQRIQVKYGSSVYFFLRDLVCDTQKDAACDGPWQNKMPMPFTVVTDITTWASRETNPEMQAEPRPEERPQVQRIYYHNGFYDGNEKSFRGFRKVESINVGDEDTSTKKDTILFDVGDKDPYFHGKTLETSSQDMTGKIYNKTTMTWKDCGTPAGVEKGLTPPARFICLSARQMTHIEGETDTNKHKTTRSEMEYDGYGNVILDRSLGDIAVEGDEAITKTTFITPNDPNSTNAIWILRAAKKLERCSKESGPCAEASYYYDGEAFKGRPLGELTKGNLSRMTIRRNLDSNDVTDARMLKFDAYGNVIEKRTVLGQRRAIEWDPIYHRFPTKETISLDEGELTATVEWDYQYSRITAATDFNGHTTRYTYDTFGRILAGFQPGDPEDKPSSQYLYELQAPISRLITKQRTKTGGEQDREQIQCFDGLNRKLAVHTRLTSGRYRVTGHVSVNQRGQMHKAWEAYESDGKCTFEPPPKHRNDATETLYDAMNRMIKRTFPDGSFERFEYKPFQTIAYDEEDNKQGSPHFNTPKISIKDGLGRVIEVQEMAKPGEVRKTRYTYTNLNIAHESYVDTVTYPNGKVKKHVYNLFGFLAKTEDPDRSTTEFVYDDSGNILERKDARGIVMLQTYDVHGRILTRQQKEKPDTLITYLYDKPDSTFPEAKNVKGRLSKVTYPGGVVLSSYTDRGSEDLTRHSLLGVPFDFRSLFNNLGDMLEEVYPDGRKLTYNYDDAGRLLKMDGFIDSITYATNGHIEKRVFSNGVETSFQVDKRGRVNEIKMTTQPGFQYNMAFDAVGNIVSTTETYGTQTFANTYQYDSLYQLTQADLRGGQEVMKYTLDIQSNLVAKVSSLGKQSLAHIGDYTIDPNRSHAATKAGEMVMDYDKAGGMIKRDNNTFEWDYAGRLKAAKQGEQAVGAYWYDHQNRRTMKLEKGILSLYPSNTFRIQDGKATIYATQNSYIAQRDSTAMMAKLYDDVAPASGDTTLTPAPDGKISAADAWLYYATQKNILKVPLKTRPVQVDLTLSMLQASVESMLSEDKEVKQFLHTDHLGSVRAVSDTSGKVVEYKRYTPYGVTEAHEGTSMTTLGFQGQEYDNAIQSYYFGARYLDPKLARWLTPDPAFARVSATQDEWNSYGVVSNNPLRYRDQGGFASEDGTSWMLIAGASIAVVASAAAAVNAASSGMGGRKQHGKRTTGSKLAFAASNALGASLGAVVIGLAIADMNEAASITSAVLGAISAIKSAVNIFYTNHQHNQIRIHSVDRYSKQRHRMGVLGRTTSLIAGAGRSVLMVAEFYQDDKSTSNIMNASALALSALSVIGTQLGTTSFRPRVTKDATAPGLSLGGFTFSTDTTHVNASKKMARRRGAQQALATDFLKSSRTAAQKARKVLVGRK